MTEVDYVQHLRRRLRRAVVEVEVVGTLGDPGSVVERAIALRDTAAMRAKRHRDPFLLYDSVWCVFDVDDHATLPGAITRARDTGIEVCVSNPCFELWPILHFDDHRAYSSTRELLAVMDRLFPGYDKSLKCEALVGRLPAAKRRALQLERDHLTAGDSPASNPSTQVWRLVDALCAAAIDGDPLFDLAQL